MPAVCRKFSALKPEPEIIATEQGLKDFYAGMAREPGRADSDPKPRNNLQPARLKPEPEIIATPQGWSDFSAGICRESGRADSDPKLK